MKNSAIQWCDHTFNPWEGCAKVAPECKNCYAETLVDHRFGRVKWGVGQPRRRTSSNLWKQPIAWNREALAFNRRDRVFCLSLGDWLDEEVPIDWLADLLRLIHETPNLDWLLLTKRPQNWKTRLEYAFEQCSSDYDSPIWKWLGGQSPENIWIGVSAGADQRAALDIPAKIHFLSCEPMLHAMETEHAAGFDWIIFGGESGRNARPCELQWIDDGIDFCARNAIACFVKQLGKHPQPRRFPTTGVTYTRETLNIKDSHGGNWDEWPTDERFRDLRHREFPCVINKLVPLEK